MFRSARLKLTAWYLLIIMLISVSFSVAVYGLLTNELNRVERIQRLRQENRLPANFLPKLRRPRVIDPEVIDETKTRIKAILLLINLAILGFSSLAGYFLAGLTLKPIKQMVDEQNRFITDASHELRTPITALKSEIEVSLRDKKLTLGQAKKLLESNLEEVNILQGLTDNLIVLSQNQKPRNNSLLNEVVSIKDILSDAQKKINPLAKQKQIKIQISSKDWQLIGERESLIEVFTILLDNAIKYSPKKSLVKISTQKTDDHIQIMITDQGLGIDQVDLPHIFDRFYRADLSRTKTHIPGFGLGLSIAKHIIERHSGVIKVTSEPNQGTTFTVTLLLHHA